MLLALMPMNVSSTESCLDGGANVNVINQGLIFRSRIINRLVPLRGIDVETSE